MSEEETEVKEEAEAEGEEVPEALEEAPADFVVDIAWLEVMIKISDLLYEASRSSEPDRYIEEIERLGSAVATVRGKKERRAVKKEAKASKRKRRSKQS